MSKIHNEDDEGKPPPGAFPLLSLGARALAHRQASRATGRIHPARLDLLRLVADVRTRHGPDNGVVGGRPLRGRRHLGSRD